MNSDTDTTELLGGFQQVCHNVCTLLACTFVRVCSMHFILTCIHNVCQLAVPDLGMGFGYRQSQVTLWQGQERLVMLMTTTLQYFQSLFIFLRWQSVQQSLQSHAHTKRMSWNQNGSTKDHQKTNEQSISMLHLLSCMTPKNTYCRIALLCILKCYPEFFLRNLSDVVILLAVSKEI